MQEPEFYLLKPESIIVDDSDPTIRYDGPWDAVNLTEIQNLGFPERKPILNTLHVLGLFTGSFSYYFAGQGVSVFTTQQVNSSFTSQCFLNGNLVPFDPNAAKAQFGQSRPVCQAFGLPGDTTHTISVNVSVPPLQQPDTSDLPTLPGFAFDYMLIQPPSDVVPWNNATHDVFVPVLDMALINNEPNPTLNFGLILGDTDKVADVNREWQFDPENGFHTTTPGSEFNLTFMGTSVWWYGYSKLPLEVNDTSPGEATFSIDGGKPKIFEVPDSSFFSASQSLLFRTPVVQYGTHLLTVVHHGNNKTSPLTLQSLVVQKSSPARLVPITTVPSLPSTTMSKIPASSVTTKRGSLGVTVGGIGGGIVFLILVASASYLLIRWTRRQKYTQTGTGITTAVQEPFHVSPDRTDTIILPRKAQPGQQNIDNPFMQQQLQAPVTKWTRRHTFSGSPGSVSSLFTAAVPPQGAREPQIVDPFIPSESAAGPPNTDAINGQDTTQLGDVLRQATLNMVIPNTSNAAQAERELDSGLRIEYVPVLPPLYTTH